MRPQNPQWSSTLTIGITLKIIILMIQQNCSKGYECTISALKAGLGLDAKFVCIQEPFLGKRDISYCGFNLYWPFELIIKSICEI